jgi:hypothetical protein
MRTHVHTRSEDTRDRVRRGGGACEAGLMNRDEDKNERQRRWAELIAESILDDEYPYIALIGCKETPGTGSCIGGARWCASAGRPLP